MMDTLFAFGLSHPLELLFWSFLVWLVLLVAITVIGELRVRSAYERGRRSVTKDFSLRWPARSTSARYQSRQEARR